MSNIGNVIVTHPDSILCESEKFNSFTSCWISDNNYTWNSKIKAPFIVNSEREKISVKLPTFYTKFSKYNKEHSWPLRADWSLIVVNLQKMVKSSFVGFRSYIKVNGVGYKLSLSERHLNKLVAHVGLTHPLTQQFHSSLDIAFTRKNRMARVRGISISSITGACSSLRNKRKPNVFTGKGLRFRNEKVWRKTGKKKRT